MKKYFNTVTNSEVIEGVHFQKVASFLPDDVVELDKADPFFSPGWLDPSEEAPEGYRAEWDGAAVVRVPIVTPAPEGDELIARLEAAALSHVRNGLGISPELEGLITSLVAAHTIAGSTIPAKLAAARDGIDQVWAEEERRENESEVNFDFSGFGSKPHGYRELRAESEGAT